jgi:hypothetical protein
MQDQGPPHLDSNRSFSDDATNRAYRAETIGYEQELRSSDSEGDMPGSINQPLHDPPRKAISTAPSNLEIAQISNNHLGVDWEQISIGEEDMKLFEGMMEDKVRFLRQTTKSEPTVHIYTNNKSNHTLPTNLALRPAQFPADRDILRD